VGVHMEEFEPMFILSMAAVVVDEQKTDFYGRDAGSGGRELRCRQ
jgi:hypothetical protein